MSALTGEHAPPTLEMPSRLDAMADARAWLQGHARHAGFDDRAIAELDLALTEALSNVIRHSYRCASDERILLSVVVDDEALVLSVRDFGEKFDRTAYKPVDLDVPQVGGYGVYFIEAVMDEVDWDTTPERGTLLRMTRFRPGHSHV